MNAGIDASNITGGGGLTHLAELLAHAQPEAEGFERIVVWAPHATLAALPERRWLDKCHHPALEGTIVRRAAWQAFSLARLAERARCEVLFVPGGTYPGRFRPFVAMSQNLLPFSPAERGRYFPSAKWLRLNLLRHSQGRTLARADTALFLTRHAKSVVENALGHPMASAAIIPHGVSEAFFCPPRPQHAVDSRAPARPFRLLYVSVVEPYKHQWHVVEAVARLRRGGMPVTLELVGAATHPPSRLRLRAAIDRCDPDGRFIAWRGHVPFAELPAIYRRADLFVFASSCENLPNILMEAMAAGVPICAADRGPMPELLGETGGFFNPESVADIERALRAALSDPDRRAAHARAGFERARHLTWSACASATFSLLAQMCRRRSDATIAATSPAIARTAP